MKGTEKQIAWAEEIVKATIKAIEEIIEQMNQMATSDAQRAIVEDSVKHYQSFVSVITAESVYAGDIIDNLKSISNARSIKEKAAVIKVASRMMKKSNA